LCLGDHPLHRDVVDGLGRGHQTLGGHKRPPTLRATANTGPYNGTVPRTICREVSGSEHTHRERYGVDMNDRVHQHLIDAIGRLAPGTAPVSDSSRLKRLLDAQLRSRHLDAAAGWLQSRGEGFYTIGSSGHEGNAAVAMALRDTDPALLHYRSGAFYCARAAQVPGSDPCGEIIASLTASRSDQISGGRHKVIGNRALSIIPQTSTIASHLPRAVGLA